MLVLSRKTNECIVIDGRILVKIVRCEGEVVKLGIEAPLDVPVHRQEIYDEIQRNNQQALTRSRSAVVKLGPARLPDKLAALVRENDVLVPSA
ncbi:MAG: carbon storage regulator CsrA [Chloroflexi bacterium]|nr:carbon storage regulator CsrA [Chloroflexota bacterium]